MLLFSSFLLTAQEEWPGKGDSEIGVILGVNFSSYYGDDADGADSKTGFLAGVSYDYYFSETWSIKGRLDYQSKGPDGLSANYVTVPINANWHFGRR